jgi:pantetheine-phosphate adenylyltransferase
MYYDDLYLNNLIKKYTSITLKDIKFYYNQSHRYYHNWSHIEEILNNIKEEEISDSLILSVLFHDIIYDPSKDDNEESSIDLFKNCYMDFNYRPISIKSDVISLILKTKNVESDETVLNKLDHDILKLPFEDLVKYELKIFKEFQFAPIDDYINRRTSFLSRFRGEDIFYLINFIKNRTYKIGLYVGSFNPFHVGHYSVLQKADKIFDKVIIAQGINTCKNNEMMIDNQFYNSDILKFYEINKYNGLLTDYLETIQNKYKNYNVEFTLVRGLRNENDFKSEINLKKWLEDLGLNLNIIYYICDNEYSHISSSAIRSLKSMTAMDKYVI